MFEVYYKAPPDPHKEALLTERVSKLGGHLSYREDAGHSAIRSVCLTYEFESLEQATVAAESLRGRGEHVEGPVDYGDGATGNAS
jgi:hypothetical protein